MHLIMDPQHISSINRCRNICFLNTNKHKMGANFWKIALICTWSINLCKSIGKRIYLYRRTVGTQFRWGQLTKLKPSLQSGRNDVIFWSGPSFGQFLIIVSSNLELFCSQSFIKLAFVDWHHMCLMGFLRTSILILVVAENLRKGDF